MRFLTFFSFLFILSSTTQAAVLGQIQRFEVPDTKAPWARVVGQISDGLRICTGTLIGPGLVITAGHCVHDIETGEFYQNLKFSPARYGNTDPYGAIEVLKVYVHPGYVQKKDPANDLAVLVLKTPVGVLTGWSELNFGLSYFERHTSALGGHKAAGTILGYPGDKSFGTMWLVACEFYVPMQLPLKPQYTCDTYGGMSGSALMMGDAMGKSVVFGIHTTGTGSYNTGISLTGDNESFLRKVLAQETI